MAPSKPAFGFFAYEKGSPDHLDGRSDFLRGEHVHHYRAPDIEHPWSKYTDGQYGGQYRYDWGGSGSATPAPKIEAKKAEPESKKEPYTDDVSVRARLNLLLDSLPDSTVAEGMLVALKAAVEQPDRAAALAKLETNLRAFDATPESSKLPTALPDEAPALYVPRGDLTASEFLKLHWQPWIDAGLLFRPQLRAYDPRLVIALANQFTGRAAELNKLLPTKYEQTRQIEASHPQLPRSAGARAAAVAALRRYPQA